MLVLALETSTPTGGAALLEDDRLLGALTLTSARGHSRHLLPFVELLLRESSRSLNDVDVVACACGPGSFTGVRVGLSVAKGLCLTGRPGLVTVSTLHALAVRAYGGEPVEWIAPMLHARRGEVYGAFCPVTDGAVGAPAEEFALRPEDMLARWPGRCLLAGEGALAFAEAWAAADAVWARADRRQPSAEQVALLGLAKARAGHFENPRTALPTYLRDPVAHPPRTAKTPPI
ncbi:MAG: tRNA (adenosine(37)-N6)-threonylcarbamoyltransferase complex dimerization subunit type 1 TsaB [Candidatus Sumerlaeia bacterium]|nr:tRNA (adenosine(37)-N6)-threonylcarbamoyltransferase complex dimerization subunit type 1 TsaB [Candidatus Sumerlaeia bacterium]